MSENAFMVGDQVEALGGGENPSWAPGVVTQRRGKTYQIKFNDGTTKKTSKVRAVVGKSVDHSATEEDLDDGGANLAEEFHYAFDTFMVCFPPIS